MRLQADDSFPQMIDGYRCVRRLTQAEAEEENTVEIDGRQVLFGYRYELWRDFVSQFQSGDELFLCSSSDEDWEQLMGVEGVVLVREGKVIDSLLTLLN